MISVRLVIYVCCYYVSCYDLGYLSVLLGWLIAIWVCGVGLFAVGWFVDCRLVAVLRYRRLDCVDAVWGLLAV